MRITNVMMYSCMLVMLFFMTSCVKYYDLITSEFPQGKDLPDKREIVARYMQTATVYDEFQTVAVFNALWLSYEVRAAYVDVYCSKRGLSPDEREEMLKRQLEENKYWVSFYVLADVRSKTNASLSDQNPMWTLHLKLGEYETLVPESIKEVDLDPELQLLFGSRFNLFKTAYLVKFPLQPVPSTSTTEPGSSEVVSVEVETAKTSQPTNVRVSVETPASTITTTTPAATPVSHVVPRPDLAKKLANGTISLVQLIVKSVHKECTLTWDRNQMAKKRKIIRDEDFYWG